MMKTFEETLAFIEAKAIEHDTDDSDWAYEFIELDAFTAIIQFSLSEGFSVSCCDLASFVKEANNSEDDDEDEKNLFWRMNEICEEMNALQDINGIPPKNARTLCFLAAQILAVISTALNRHDCASFEDGQSSINRIVPPSFLIKTTSANIMSSKFACVPIEEDTKVIDQLEAMLGCYPVLYQKWHWDGIVAESFIFANEDIAGLSDEELEKEVKESPMCKENSRITVKRTDDGFTFVNFNFEVLE